MKNVLLITLAILLGFMTFVAWHDSRPLNCDKQDTDYTTGDTVCTIYLHNGKRNK